MTKQFANREWIRTRNRPRQPKAQPASLCLLAALLCVSNSVRFELSYQRYLSKTGSRTVLTINHGCNNSFLFYKKFGYIIALPVPKRKYTHNPRTIFEKEGFSYFKIAL